LLVVHEILICQTNSIYMINRKKMVIIKVHTSNKYRFSLCLNFFHLLAQIPNLEFFSIYSNKFFHNIHLSESSFTCAWLRANGLAWKLNYWLKNIKKIAWCCQNFDVKIHTSNEYQKKYRKKKFIWFMEQIFL
jgi:hypothetical protein